MEQKWHPSAKNLFPCSFPLTSVENSKTQRPFKHVTACHAGLISPPNPSSQSDSVAPCSVAWPFFEMYLCDYMASAGVVLSGKFLEDIVSLLLRREPAMCYMLLSEQVWAGMIADMKEGERTRTNNMGCSTVTVIGAITHQKIVPDRGQVTAYGFSPMGTICKTLKKAQALEKPPWVYITSNGKQRA